MQYVREIVFHNGEELKKEMDKVEIEIEGRSNFMFLNHAILTEQIDIIGDKVVQKDYDGNIISETDCSKIFSFKIYSDETGGYEDWDDYERCYSFVNHQLQFLDDFDRANFAYDLLKNSDGDELFLTEELEKAVVAHMEQGTGTLIVPEGFDESELDGDGPISEENFIKLVQLKLESNTNPDDMKVKPKIYNKDSIQLVTYRFKK